MSPFVTVGPSVCLSVRLSVRPSVTKFKILNPNFESKHGLSLTARVCESVRHSRSVRLSVCPSVCLFICHKIQNFESKFRIQAWVEFDHPSVRLSIRLSVRPSVHHPSVTKFKILNPSFESKHRLSLTGPSFCQFVCPFVCQSVRPKIQKEKAVDSHTIGFKTQTL